MRDGDSFDKLILRQNYELVCLIHINSVMVHVENRASVPVRLGLQSRLRNRD
jgi:hypothetical protein